MSDDAKIDDAILSITAENRHQMKVAMLIAKVSASVYGSVGDESRLQQIADRIEALVARGQLAGFGDGKRWRHSEVQAVARNV